MSQKDSKIRDLNAQLREAQGHERDTDSVKRELGRAQAEADDLAAQVERLEKENRRLEAQANKPISQPRQDSPKAKKERGTADMDARVKAMMAESETRSRGGSKESASQSREPEARSPRRGGAWEDDQKAELERANRNVERLQKKQEDARAKEARKRMY